MDNENKTRYVIDNSPAIGDRKIYLGAIAVMMRAGYTKLNRKEDVDRARKVLQDSKIMYTSDELGHLNACLDARENIIEFDNYGQVVIED